MSNTLRHSDICLSIRAIGGAFGSAEAALTLMDQVKPTRIEWSYIKDRDLIAKFKAVTPVFVAALNTIAPPGHAESFLGRPIIAPWMKRFGKPGGRSSYICQNNPEDLQVRIEQAVEFMAEGVTSSFQFDDWNGNAQMFDFGNPCFCRHCMREFSLDLGIDIDYRQYLRGRGHADLSGLLEGAKAGKVPLWDDFKRFQKQTVMRYFRTLREALDQAFGGSISLSANGSVLGFGGPIDSIIPFVDYLNSETQDFSPGTLLKLAHASRKLGIKQITSFLPHIPVAQYHAPEVVNRVRQAIGVAYCLGLIPQFPYDVYMGNEADGSVKARWFGAWEEYRTPYEVVRQNPQWFDDYAFTTCEEHGDGSVTVVSQHIRQPGRHLTHHLTSTGQWKTTPAE